MFREYDLIINHTKRCRDFGIYISSRVNIPAPIMEYEDINIIGKDGTLTKEKGYSNREISVNFNFFNLFSMPKMIRELNSIFLNAESIMFTDDDEVFYRVNKVILSDVEREVRHYGFFTVTFVVQPFSYHNRVYPITITKNNHKLMNPTNYYSLPKITIHGKGDITVTVNDTTTLFRNVEDYITVDSEILETYKDDTLQNNKKVGEYFTFDVGVNNISWIGNVDKIVVEPQWRWL